MRSDRSRNFNFRGAVHKCPTCGVRQQLTWAFCWVECELKGYPKLNCHMLIMSWGRQALLRPLLFAANEHWRCIFGILDLRILAFVLTVPVHARILGLYYSKKFVIKLPFFPILSFLQLPKKEPERSFSHLNLGLILFLNSKPNSFLEFGTIISSF